jgi:RHS repeat-associated protein
MLTRVMLTVGGSTTTTYAYDWQDRLLSATTGSNVKSYLYDANGNCNEVKWNGTTTVTLSYDVENRVTGISYAGGGSNSFAYNGVNLRTSKTDSGGTKTYVTDGVNPASSVLKDGAAVYTPGTSERRGSTSSFYHADALGSTRNITNSSQSTTDTMLTDAFGNSLNRTGSNPTPFGFAGEWQYQADSQSGLMLLGNRYYDAEAGRFISKDPIKDGDNWYAYCNNNPLKWIDPSGLQKAEEKEKADEKKEKPKTLWDWIWPKDPVDYIGDRIRPPKDKSIFLPSGGIHYPPGYKGPYKPIPGGKSYPMASGGRVIVYPTPRGSKNPPRPGRNDPGQPYPYENGGKPIDLLPGSVLEDPGDKFLIIIRKPLPSK